MTDSRDPTHVAYSRKRLGRRHFEWLEIGKGRLDDNGVFHGLLKTTPIGGFDGYVYFTPIGAQPPGTESPSQHTGQLTEDGEP